VQIAGRGDCPGLDVAPDGTIESAGETNLRRDNTNSPVPEIPSQRQGKASVQRLASGKTKENDMSRKHLVFVSILAVAGMLGGLLFALAPPSRVSAQDDMPGSQEGLALAPDLGPVGTGFTYQGYLEDGGGAANGSYDFEFSLYDAGAAGTQIGSTLSVNGVIVSNGLFTVKLDFGQSAFAGGARWLEIGVRASGGGTFTVLNPRQELTPAPSALSLPNVYVDEANNFVGVGRDFRISGNEVFGVRYNGPADEYGGMYVETSDAQGWPFYGYATNGSFRAWTYYNGTSGDWFLYDAGVRLHVREEGGLRITPSITTTDSNSLVISGTTTIHSTDGIRIYDTADDGLQVGSDPDYPNYGLYIPSPGVSTYGLWPNTANASGQWALYTADNIEAGNVLLNGLTILARVGGDTALSPGDVVTAVGMGEAVPGAQDPLAVVSLAGSPGGGIVGVVKSRMVYEVAPGKEAEGEMSMHSADGPAQPGDYVSLVVLGVTQVKIDASANIQPGDRLTAALSGYARLLESRTLDGMVVSEGASVLGIALAAPVEGQTTIPVFVTLR
jgi:hypothetical protein